MRRSYREVAHDIVEWVYTDTMVDDLDEAFIITCLREDTDSDVTKLPTESEVELLVTGEETEAAALRARYPKTDAYLAEQLS